MLDTASCRLAGARQLVLFHDRYREFFQRDNVYLSGKAFSLHERVFQADKINMERMEGVVSEPAHDHLQYFFSDTTLLKSALSKRDISELEVLKQLEIRQKTAVCN